MEKNVDSENAIYFKQDEPTPVQARTKSYQHFNPMIDQKGIMGPMHPFQDKNHFQPLDGSSYEYMPTSNSMQNLNEMGQ